MTDKEWDEMMEAYRERFGKYPPYNMGDPDEHGRLVQEALDKDEPMPETDIPKGIEI
jgi:hypothetical protein